MRDGFLFQDISEIKVFIFLKQEKLAKLSSNGSMKIAFQENSFLNFWLCEYAKVAEKATKKLLPSCEKTFSSLVQMKNKCRNDWTLN